MGRESESQPKRSVRAARVWLVLVLGSVALLGLRDAHQLYARRRADLGEAIEAVVV